MNLKIFTLSILFLLFIGNTNAQEFSNASTENTIEVTIVVDSTSRVLNPRKSFRLIAPDNQSVPRFGNFRLKVNLEYLSSLSTTSYFRLAYRVYGTSNGIVGPLSHGVTTPVIIPPVKKKILQIVEGFVAGYPYVITSNFPLTGANYTVEVELTKYETEQDQQNDSGVKILLPKIEFTFRTNAYTTARIENTTTPLNLITYPNPSTDYVIIELVNTTVNSVSKKDEPLQLTIFNKEGASISTHNLIRTSVENNNSLYNVDITHLPKGMYFFQMKDGKNTQVKTILKE
jgi:hypothetical protein